MAQIIACGGAKCLKHLCNLCKISEEADLFFTHEEFRQYDSNVHKFLQYYNKLSYHSYSLDNARVGHFQWGQIPTMHFLCHISEDAQFLNPRAVWAYPGEHLVGNATKLAAACLAGLQPYQVPNTICKKYQIGKHFAISTAGLKKGAAWTLQKLHLLWRTCSRAFLRFLSSVCSCWGPAEGPMQSQTVQFLIWKYWKVGPQILIYFSIFLTSLS